MSPLYLLYALLTLAGVIVTVTLASAKLREFGLRLPQPPQLWPVEVYDAPIKRGNEWSKKGIEATRIWVATIVFYAVVSAFVFGSLAFVIARHS